MIRDISIPLYPVDIFLAIGESLDNIHKYFDKRKEKNFHRLCFERVGYNCIHYNINESWVLLDYFFRDEKIDKDIFTPENHGSIAHEIFHVKNKILEMIHDQPSVSNDEMEAYIITYLTVVVYYEFNNYLKRRRK